MATMLPPDAAREATAEDWVWLIEVLMDELTSASPATRAKVGERLLARPGYIEADTLHARDEIKGLRQSTLTRLAGRLKG